MNERESAISRPSFPVDLHAHTRISDGTDSPAEIVERARERGIRVLGITDHDSIAGVEAALEYGRQAGLQVVPGVEISVANEPERDFLDLHLLGYFMDPRHGGLNAALGRAERARYDQKIVMVHRLQALGLDVPLEEVLALAGEGILSRVHIAQVALAHNPDRLTSREQVFRDYLSPGSPAYAPRSYQIGLAEAAAVIRDAGGLPILAHPGAYPRVQDADALVSRMGEYGVAGIEGPYPYDKNRPHFGMSAVDVAEMIRHFTLLARSHGLLVTGGSDYHGTRKTTRLGEQGLTMDEYAVLEDARP